MSIHLDQMISERIAQPIESYLRAQECDVVFNLHRQHKKAPVISVLLVID